MHLTTPPLHARRRIEVRDDLLRAGRPVVATRSALEHQAAPAPAAVAHGHAALAFYTGGRSRMELDGEWMLREGDVLLVPAGAAHRSLAKEHAASWRLGFHIPWFAARGGASMLDTFERVRDGASAVVSIPAARHEHLAGLFRELAATGTRARIAPATLEAVQASLLTLILAEVGEASAPDPPRRDGGVGVVAAALRVIERRCLGPLTLEEVAAAVGRSATYVTTALTRATGRSAGQWIVGGRMAEARRLLLSSSERVDAIAERVGYADATHFIRMFRREHGATPAAWRAAQARALGA